MNKCLNREERVAGSILLLVFPVSPCYLNLFMANGALRVSNWLNAFASPIYEPHIIEEVILWLDYKGSCAV